MSDRPTDDKYLQALSKMLELQFKNQDTKIATQFKNQDIKMDVVRDRVLEMKQSFGNRVDKIDSKLDELTKVQNSHLVNLTRVETETQLTGKNRGVLFGIAGGIFSSILITTITKVIGF